MGFADVSIPKIFAHLDAKYGEITRDNFKQNCNKLSWIVHLALPTETDGPLELLLLLPPLSSWRWVRNMAWTPWPILWMRLDKGVVKVHRFMVLYDNTLQLAKLRAL